MNNFTVRYSDEAKLDLAEIYAFIANEYKEPKTAEKIIQRIMASISDLSFMADSYHVYDEEPFRSLGLRYFSEGKYCIFYKIYENTAFIVRIINGRRNIPKLL